MPPAGNYGGCSSKTPAKIVADHIFVYRKMERENRKEGKGL
jgi:hypothetical protein